MPDLTLMLLLLGFIFLIGLAAESVGRRTPLPRVTLLIIVGVALGPSLLGWLEPAGTQWFTVVSQVALTMVGFLLGGHLTRRSLKCHGADILVLSIAVVAVTASLVCAAVWLVTADQAGKPLRRKLSVQMIDRAVAGLKIKICSDVFAVEVADLP